LRRAERDAGRVGREADAIAVQVVAVADVVGDEQRAVARLDDVLVGLLGRQEVLRTGGAGREDRAADGREPGGEPGATGRAGPPRAPVRRV